MTSRCRTDPETHLIQNSVVSGAKVLFCSVHVSQAGPGPFSVALQDDPKTDLNEVKGLLEVALLEKHFLREYSLDIFLWTLLQQRNFGWFYKFDNLQSDLI